MRTARDRTSAENLFVVGLLIAPSSQDVEPPANPVRFSPHRAENPARSEPRCDDMVGYMEWASEGSAHQFAVESDELWLKTNVRVGPLTARLSHRAWRLRTCAP